MHKLWPGRRGYWVQYEHINNSDLDGMSLAPFCQSSGVHRNPRGGGGLINGSNLCAKNKG